MVHVKLEKLEEIFQVASQKPQNCCNAYTVKIALYLGPILTKLGKPGYILKAEKHIFTTRAIASDSV